jgi:carboxymethylenebutenolidase
MGGMYALKVASIGAVDRTVAFYGMIRVPPTWEGPEQAQPLDLLHRRSPRTQVLAIVGGRDPYTPPADVAELAEVDGVTVVQYPEAEHGFVHDATRPAHRPEDAADAWSRATEFLRS